MLRKFSIGKTMVVLVVSLLLFMACAATAEITTIFSTIPSVFCFTSGVGGWSTELYMKPDGTFTGYYHDSDMGDMGSGYPKGTLYECYFNGKFTDAYQIGENEYSMRLEYLNLDHAAGQTTIIDGVRIITSEPNGLENAREFRLYLPNRVTTDLPEPFLDWVRAPGVWNDTPTLQVYGLYNAGGEQGFFAIPEGGGVSVPPVISTATVYGYANKNKTNLRPSTTTSGKAIGCIMKGDRVEILGEVTGGGENWYHVRTEKVIIGDNYEYGDFEGYIVKRLVNVSTVPSASPRKMPVTVQCPACGGWFEEGNVFRNHICIAATQPERVQCPACDGWFEEGNVFRNHICPAVP